MPALAPIRFIGRHIARPVLAHRAERIFARIRPWLPLEGRILELGPGSCIFTKILRRHNYHVVPLDVYDLSLVPEIKPVLYDGRRPPFRPGTFDCGIALFVLHHIPACETKLSNLLSLARRWIIAEDLYESPLRSRVTAAMDHLLNLFSSEQHGLGRSDSQWKEIFSKQGWQVLQTVRHGSEFWFNPLVQQATYILEPMDIG